MKVLIVDDSKILRERLIERISKMDNVEVIDWAETSNEATESIKRLEPDFVILDIKLKSGTGIDVLCNMKQMKINTEVAVFTSYPYPHYRKRCQEEGANFFFNKSSEFEELFKSIEICAGKKV